MLKEIKEVFVASRGGFNQEKIKQQNKSLMTRAWLLHSLKTIILAIMATSGRPYWEQEEKEGDPDCSPRKFLLSEDANLTIIT